MLPISFQSILLEAGCDEAGRGCLAGPVVAAAVILPKDFNLPGLNDSKQLSERKRLQLRPLIEEQALAWAVAEVDHQEIDQINILNASFLAMHRALAKLKIAPEFIAVDGNRFKKYEQLPHTCVVKGDAKYQNIAAASILAKTYRDDLMEQLDTAYPIYNWKQNKGYPTQEHRDAVLKYGLSPFHRKTFQLKSAQMSLKF
jgi:ribonuclease HII